MVNMVMNKIDEMGFRNLTLASSSLIASHFAIVEHIKLPWSPECILLLHAVNLQSNFSCGLLNKPVTIHSHGLRVHLVKSGEL